MAHVYVRHLPDPRPLFLKLGFIRMPELCLSGANI
jgi:hypothetical protein